MAVAYLALMGFLPYALVVYRALPRAMATAVVVVSGSILLPERVAFDFPYIPPLEKEYVTYLSVLIAALIFRRGDVARAVPGRGLEAMAVPSLLAMIGTAAMNRQDVFDEGKLEVALGLYWYIANSADEIMTLAIPFFLGRAMIRSTADLRVLLSVLGVAGALYVLPMLVEVLLSIPFRVFHLSQVLYGVPMRPQWRWGFVQPVLFMDNGLSLATFMASALVAANGFVRARLRMLGCPARVVRYVILAGLVMTLNVAGNVYGWVFTLASRLFRPSRIAWIAVGLTSLAVLYPLLRIVDVFPNESLVDLAARFDVQRARSLEGRFFEEDHVLSHIGSRLWVGWGDFDRIPGAETFGTGESGLDGWWTIQLGEKGLIGVALYDLVLGIPVFLALRRFRRLESWRERSLMAALMATVSMRMIDLLINGWWNTLPMFLAGALYGVARSVGRGTPSARTVPIAAGSGSGVGGARVAPRFDMY